MDVLFTKFSSVSWADGGSSLCSQSYCFMYDCYFNVSDFALSCHLTQSALLLLDLVSLWRVKSSPASSLKTSNILDIQWDPGALQQASHLTYHVSELSTHSDWWPLIEPQIHLRSDPFVFDFKIWLSVNLSYERGGRLITDFNLYIV